MRLLASTALAAVLAAGVAAQEPVWTQVDAPTPIFFADGDRYVGAFPFGAERGLLVSTDGGGSWIEVFDGLPDDELAVPVFLKGDTAFATTDTGRLYRSADGGLTWSQSDTGLVSSRPDDDGRGRYLVDLIRVADDYLAVTSFSVFTARAEPDAGSAANPWMPTTGLPGYSDTGIDFFAFSAAAVGDDVVLASTFGLYRSADGGATWSASSDGFEISGAPLEAWRVDSFDGRLFALANYSAPFGGVYRSDDGGATWARASRGLVMQFDAGGAETGIQQLLTVDSSGDALFVGTVGGEGLYRSTNGEDWEPFNEGLPVDPDFGRAVPYIWTDSGGEAQAPLFVIANLFDPQFTFRVDRSAGTSTDSPAVPGPTFAIQQAWPNPAVREISVDFNLDVEADVEAQIYDAIGRVVGQRSGTRFEDGSHRIDFPLPGLAPGVYSVVLTARGGGQSRSTMARFSIVR